QHFGRGLPHHYPSAWADSVRALLEYLASGRWEVKPSEQPARLFALSESEPPRSAIELPGAWGDAWLRGQAVRARHIRIGLRGGVTVGIDVARQRWSLDGLGSKRHEGATPPLRAEAVAFALEMAGEMLQVGVAGAIVGRAFEGLPQATGPLRVE